MTFTEVVGQEHVIDPLVRAIEAGRFNHAYLLSGPAGCGKTSTARILARALNCVHGPTVRPCASCRSCLALAPGGSGTLDVAEWDAATHGGLDDIRELRDWACSLPIESRYRVLIFDQAHMITDLGSNALLKLVEEPPEHLVVIFVTTESHRISPPLRSRTYQYPFRLLPAAVMRELLERITEQEPVHVEESVYPLMIRAGGGAVRDTLGVLDQLIAGAVSGVVTIAQAATLLGSVDVALIDDVIEALANSDGSAAFTTIDRVIEAGHDPRQFATGLLERVRDLILVQAIPDAGERGLVPGPPAMLARMRVDSDRIGAQTLARYAEVIYASLTDSWGATPPRLLLELMCARLLLRTVTGPIAAPGSWRDSHAPVAAQSEFPATTTDAVAAWTDSASLDRYPTEQQPPGPGLPDVADARAAWPEVRANVSQRSRTVEVLLGGATVQAVDGATLVLRHESMVIAKRLGEARNVGVLRDALAVVFGVDCRVVFDTERRDANAEP